MSIRTGNDEFTYEIVEGWGMSSGTGIDGAFDIAGVGVDSKGQLYLFNRGERPMIVLDRNGEFIHSWGDKRMFPNAHAVTIGPDDSIWLTDTLDHTVRECTAEGKVLLTLGTSGKPAKSMNGQPFCRCTHVAIHPNTGELFVADGYGNASVHKYTPDGRLLYSWGAPGNRPGQFNLPHNICTDRDGYVYVADRENQRVQVFTPHGKLEDIWTSMARPCGMYIDTRGAQTCYIGELSSAWWCQNAKDLWEICNQPGCGPRISIYTLEGDLRATLLDNAQGEAPNQMIAPHGIAVDSMGDIYIGEVSVTVGLWFPRKDNTRPLRTILKLARVRKPAITN